MGTLGREKLDDVKRNSDYFRNALIEMYVQHNYGCVPCVTRLLCCFATTWHDAMCIS